MDHRESAEAPLRIAVVSTPRTGTTWVRSLLRQAYGLTEQAFHSAAEVPWDRLPDRYLLGIHWHTTDEFVGALRDHGFRVVTLARHPLDALISILRFSPLRDDTFRWLEGEGGDEREINGACPADPAFLRYATGPRARALLSVSAEWCDHPLAFCLRYEQLVEDPGRQLGELVRWLGSPPIRPLNEVIAASSGEEMSKQSELHTTHIWLAQPGAWRHFIPRAAADEIARAQPDAFQKFGYDTDADANPTEAIAKLAWYETLARTGIRDTRQLQERSGRLRRDLADLHAHVAGTQRQVERANVLYQEADRERQAADRERQAAERARDELATQLIAAQTAMSALASDRDRLTAERDQLTAERDGLASERDRLAAERVVLASERDALRTALAPFDGLGPGSLACARAAQRIARTLPLPKSALRRVANRIAFSRRPADRVPSADRGERDEHDEDPKAGGPAARPRRVTRVVRPAA